MPTPTPHARVTAAAAGLAALALLAACTGGDAGPAATATPGSVPVIQPGLPGEPNATVTPSATPVAAATASAADARFYREMIAHHAQAIVMVDAVTGHLSDPQVAALAARIRDEQKPEILAMATWLENRGQPVPPEAANPGLAEHGSHPGMPGMATEAELAELARARGGQADRLFLRLMVRHHEGALAMVDRHVGEVSDVQVEQLSAEITATQSKQVAQMRQMLQRLG